MARCVVIPKDGYGVDAARAYMNLRDDVRTALIRGDLRTAEKRLAPGATGKSRRGHPRPPTAILPDLNADLRPDPGRNGAHALSSRSCYSSTRGAASLAKAAGPSVASAMSASCASVSSPVSTSATAATAATSTWPLTSSRA